jgi:predicted component of type VI protein secretion system
VAEAAHAIRTWVTTGRRKSVAHIQIYYRDILKDEVELQSDVTTIGRSYDSDILIDNAGVSSHHAKIIKVGDDFIIEDNASRNGIFVNGRRVSRQPLNYGDDVEISKHTLKLTVLGGHASLPESANNDNLQAIQGATVEVDVTNLGDMLKNRKGRVEAFLLLTGLVRGRTRYPLNKLSFNIGKSQNCDLYTPGWFAPRQAARVVRKSDGFYIIPRMRGRVRVNEMPVSAPMKLDDGDGISVRGLSFKFLIKQPEKL